MVTDCGGVCVRILRLVNTRVRLDFHFDLTFDRNGFRDFGVRVKSEPGRRTVPVNFAPIADLAIIEQQNCTVDLTVDFEVGVLAVLDRTGSVSRGGDRSGKREKRSTRSTNHKGLFESHSFAP